MANKNFKVRHGLEVGDNFTVTASSGNVAVGGNLTVTGDLTVNGNTTQINTDVLNVEDNEIVLNSNVTGSALLDASLIINRGTDADVSIKWNENTNKWQFTNDGTTFYDFILTDANTTYTVSAETATGGVNFRLTGSDASTDDVKFAEGTGITVTRTDANTITFATTVVDTNTTYTISATDGTTGKKIIRLSGSDATTDDVTLVEGTGISLTRSGDEITIAAVSPGTTYAISAETATGGANLRLTGSDTTTDDVKIASGTGVTVSRTDANTINVAIGQAVGTGDSPSFAAIGVDSIANIDTATLVTSATTANQVLDSWSITTYRNAKYQITIGSGSEYQVVEMFVLQDGTGAYQTTYADMRSGSNDLATFAVDINTGNCRVLTTPTNAVTTYKIVRTTIVV